jgi:phosphatidylserine/phosphatidylglycerophosphate/cardiolipin synthase-like enzyme
MSVLWREFLDDLGQDGMALVMEELESLTDNKAFSGRQFIDDIDGKIDRRLATNALYYLLDQGYIETIKAGYSIDRYSFRVAQKQMKKEEIVSVEQRTQEDEASKARIVVTLPPDAELETNLPDGIGWIYPTLRGLIARATKTIDIVSPFFDIVGTELLAMELAEATKRGVSVRVASRALVDDPPNQGAIDSLNRLHEVLRRHGKSDIIQIRSFHRGRSETNPRHSSIHGKAIVTDRRLAYIGSANITEYSLRSNFEVGVVIEGKQVEQFSKLFDTLWSISEVVTLEDVLSKTTGK